jgi:hypothetical protein
LSRELRRRRKTPPAARPAALGGWPTCPRASSPRTRPGEGSARRGARRARPA